MSWDLYFTHPIINKTEFVSYFNNRKGYKTEAEQALYENEDTGVYFIFDFNGAPSVEDDIEASVTFCLNYFRPHFFALEAAEELRNFITHFKFKTFDGQGNGMGESAFTIDGFLTSWNSGNEFGYRSILGQSQQTEKFFARPTSELEEVWKWNFHRDDRQNIIGEDIFIPKISYIEINDALASCIVWPDAISIVIPEVDYLFVIRNELAPIKVFGKKKDECLVPFKEAIEIISKYKCNKYNTLCYELPSPIAPKEIVDYVKRLEPSEDEITLIAPDSVHNLELIKKYADVTKICT